MGERSGGGTLPDVCDICKGVLDCTLYACQGFACTTRMYMVVGIETSNVMS